MARHPKKQRRRLSWTGTIALGLLFASSRPTSAATPPNTLNAPVIWAVEQPGISGPRFAAFRKALAVGPDSAGGSIRIFADSRYLLWINGSYVQRGPARFIPAAPSYDQIDLTGKLTPGRNELVVLVLAGVSNGWTMRHSPGLQVSLSVGGKEIAVTDSSWVTSTDIRYRVPLVTWGNVRDQIDATAEDGDWLQTGYDDTHWTPAQLVDPSAWGPVSKRQSDLLRDLPVPISAQLSLPVTLHAGQSWHFTCGRLVQAYLDLELEAAPGTEADFTCAGIHYRAKAGLQSFLSSNTYAFADGSIVVTRGQLTLRRFAVVEHLYPFDVKGSFSCDNANLTSVWETCVRSCQLLSEDAYVDTADRERVEWIDNDPPAYDVTRVALRTERDPESHLAAGALERDMIRRTAQTLQPGGWVKAHTASDRFDRHAKMEDRACVWIEDAWHYLETTGDVATIREVWPAMKTQLATLLAARSPRGLVLAREWVAWGNPLQYVEVEGTALNSLVHGALHAASDLAGQLGDQAARADFSAAAIALQANIDRYLWDRQSGCYSAGLIANPKRRAETLAALVDYDGKTSSYRAIDSGPGAGNSHSRPPFLGGNLPVDPTGRIAPTLLANLTVLQEGIVSADHLATTRSFVDAHATEAEGIMTLSSLFQEEAAEDRPLLDEQILKEIDHRWMPMVESPWHATWEDFSRGSKAHIYGIFPAYYLSAYVLGVRRAAPGSDTLLIDPRLGRLSRAEGTVMTESGPVQVRWIASGKSLAFSIDLPTAAHALLSLRASKITLDGITTDQAQREGSRSIVPLSGGRYTGRAQLDTPGEATTIAPPKPTG